MAYRPVTPAAHCVAASRRYWVHHCMMLPNVRLQALSRTLADPALDVPDRVAMLRHVRTALRQRYARMVARTA